MEKQLTPKQKARQKYEIMHKEERDKDQWRCAWPLRGR